MWEALLWLYLVNATVLVVHEIDSAYWQEWKLFRLPGGIGLFLALHVPLVLAALLGLALVARGEPIGLVFAALLSVAGVLAFLIHMYFLARGREEFRTPASIAVLGATLLASLAQGAATLLIILGWK
jgi:hypothetical protein